jgi:hypothetical protein
MALAPYVFWPTIAEVINSSLELMRGKDPDETITSVQSASAVQVLSYLITSWQVHGLQVWLRSDSGAVTMVASDGSYTIGLGGTRDITLDRPLEIYQAWLQDSSGNRIPLTQVSENEFNLLGNTTTEGTPNTYYYHATATATPKDNTTYGTLKIWPEPDTTAVANYTLHFSYVRPFYTSTTTTDKLDFPQEWFNALRWNLAYQLAPSYGTPISELDRYERRAQYELEQVLGWDAEKTSLRIFPNELILRNR